MLQSLEDIQERVARGGKRFGRPFLLCCPDPVWPVWIGEIEAMFPPNSLNVLVFTEEMLHGRHYTAKALANYDFIITTYPTLRVPRHVEQLGQLSFRAIFCDEAHEVRNDETMAHSSICALSADAKWYISGTPIHNHADNLRAALLLIGVPAEAMETDQQLKDIMPLFYLRREHHSGASFLDIYYQ